MAIVRVCFKIHFLIFALGNRKCFYFVFEDFLHPMFKSKHEKMNF